MPGLPAAGSGKLSMVVVAEAVGVTPLPHCGGLPARRGRCSLIDKIFWETKAAA